MRSYHDLGGTAAGPIPLEEHDLQLWEKRVEALLILFIRKKIMRQDENRRALESIGADIYHTLSYAERRILSLSNMLIQKGTFTVEELVTKIAEIENREQPLP